MPFDYQNPTYREARRHALNRSKGCCQFCGLKQADDAHHWRGYSERDYLPPEQTTADELIGLCRDCHKIASAIKARFKAIIFKEQDLDRKEKELKERENQIAEAEYYHFEFRNGMNHK